jgi:hypothetical protein
VVSVKNISLLLVPIVLIFCCAEIAVAQSAGTRVILAPSTHLRKGVDGWPLIAHPLNPAEQRINATLSHLTTKLAGAIQDCDQSERESASSASPAELKADLAQDWSRTVLVTMNGPRFLSLTAADNADCGGAHPNTSFVALVFDLQTGSPVNWTRYVAADKKPSGFADTVLDGTTAGALILPGLEHLYIACADKDCKDAFSTPQSFLIWPDAATGTLIASAFDLPFVTAACADPINLSLSQARSLGFRDEMLTAIAAAHQASGKP